MGKRRGRNVRIDETERRDNLISKDHLSPLISSHFFPQHSTQDPSSLRTCFLRWHHHSSRFRAPLELAHDGGIQSWHGSPSLFGKIANLIYLDLISPFDSDSFPNSPSHLYKNPSNSNIHLLRLP